MFKLRTLAPVFALLFGLLTLLSSCDENSDPEPTPEITPAALTASSSWRLDEISLNGQTSSSGATIKDRYTLNFRPGGSYTQTLLADSTAYVGTWMLMGSNVLHFVDHKGDSHEYTLKGLTSQKLRYSWINKAGHTEEDLFSAQP
jgi:hypothetical protein